MALLLAFSLSLTLSTAFHQPHPTAEGTLVVGGGIAGLATAAALRSIAHVQDVHVLERASEDDFCDEHAGAAVQLGPNGLKALRAIGGTEFLEQIMQEGTVLSGHAMFAADGTVTKIPDFTQQQTGLGQVLIRWGVLRRLLTNLLPPESITHGVKQTMGYRFTEQGGVQLVDAHGQDVTSRGAAPLIVAADGIQSVFAAMLQRGPSTAVTRQDLLTLNRDNGRLNIKATAPIELGDDYEKRFTYSYFLPDGSVACFAGPAGKGYTYWAISVADTKSADGSVTRFLQGVLDENHSVNLDLVKEELLRKIESLETPICQFFMDLIAATDANRIFVRRSEESKQIGPSLWFPQDEDNQSKIVLVGDAGHAMSPTYGQSPNFALEDAATLAYCVGEYRHNLPQAVQTYSESRVDRCTDMVRRSAERVQKAIKGEPTEDVSKWIFQWTPPSEEGTGFEKD